MTRPPILFATRVSLLALLAISLSMPAPVSGATLLKSICRLKGQEENSLHGLGIVVGLDGNGDGGNYMPTVRSLAKMMSMMGEQLGPEGLSELKNAKNIALVSVTATVPAAGARQGDQINCRVASIGSAKSLRGGTLFLTPLVGPDPNDPQVYAFARGPITVDNDEMLTTGTVYDGCQLESDFFNAFTKEDKVTLVLERNHAGFEMAQEVAELVNSQLSFGAGGLPLARAINQQNIEVTVPSQYREDPVLFVSLVMRLQLMEPTPEARVVVNERAGSIVIGGEVEIGPVVVSHKDMVIEAGTMGGGNGFVPVDPAETATPKLKALVEALNAVQVPTEDVIAIIKGLDRNGQLYGKLVVE
jgi:flagellar P-ring protein precursor FlgI